MQQEVYQNRDEKIAEYMKLPKKAIVEMLLNCNELLESQTKIPERLKCDVCGCHPNTIITTSYGTFCVEHAIYTKI